MFGYATVDVENGLRAKFTPDFLQVSFDFF